PGPAKLKLNRSFSHLPQPDLSSTHTLRFGLPYGLPPELCYFSILSLHAHVQAFPYNQEDSEGQAMEKLT
ncbi:hypothetical protein P7K49_039505, partial [Saguinus oedipus]